MLLKGKKGFLHLSPSAMSSKIHKLMLNPLHLIRFMVSVMMFILSCLSAPIPCRPDIVDRIVAVVNNEVVTLTDIRVIKAFGLFEDIAEAEEEMASRILDRLIDQKLVIQVSPENIKVEQAELDEYQEMLTEKLGKERVLKVLGALGLEWADLRAYFQEKILFQKIIYQRFGQTVVVSLEEIEEFYRSRYIPSQREKGQEPQPMMEILREIESIIREDKMERRIQEWLGNIKKQADIQIKVDDLNNYIKL